MTSANERPGLIIIGGGVMGSAIAYYASKKGRKALVIERRDQAAGSAGATDGVVGFHTKKPGLQMELAVRSIALFPALAEELGHDIEYGDKCGGLQPVEDRRQWDLLMAMSAEQRASGVDIRMIGIDEARELEPQLSPKLMGALYSPTSGKVNPILLTFAFASAAKKLGATFLNETEVTGFIRDQEKILGVRTSVGEFLGDKVVIAAGSWSARVAEMAGVSIPIKPRKGQIVITEPVGPFMTTTVQCARYNMIKFRPESITDAEVIRTGSSLSIGQAHDGAIVIGGTREFAGFDTDNTLEGVAMIVKRAAQFFPALKDVHVVRTFAGLRPFTPDGLPLLGEVNALKGLYIAAGHEGDGIALSPITGFLMAELLVDGQPSFPLEPFSPNRFQTNTRSESS